MQIRKEAFVTSMRKRREKAVGLEHIEPDPSLVHSGPVNLSLFQPSAERVPSLDLVEVGPVVSDRFGT